MSDFPDFDSAADEHLVALERAQAKKLEAEGGCAFPTAGNRLGTDGMTLRDYFAATALPTLLTQLFADSEGNWEYGTVASEAYAVADNLLKERNK